MRTFRSICKEFKPGFTLVEVLVVVALVGILATAIVIAINPAKRIGQAYDSQRKGDLASIARALQVQYVDRLAYPDPGVYADGDGLAHGSDSTQTSFGGFWIPQLVPDYLKTLPNDPKQGGGPALPQAFLNNFDVLAADERKYLGSVAAATSTLQEGIFITRGALGFETGLNPAKYNLPYIAGWSLAQQWAKVEPFDDDFRWAYLDSKLTELKNAGKKANVRINAGPSSPDWLRTQYGIKVLCWNQSGAPLNPSWNCFPWMMDATYQAERREMLQALYNHYHVQRPDLESTISYVYVSMPNHIKAEEFVQVQNSSDTVYVDTNDVNGVAIGIYCVSPFTCPTSAIQALPTSTFALQGYNNIDPDTGLYATHKNSIIEAAAVMPTWKLRVMHAASQPSPLALVQNSYNTILNNGLIGRVSIGFTWLGRTPAFSSDQVVWDDIKANFFNSAQGEGLIGWETHDSVPADQIYEEWCKTGAPLKSKAFSIGAHLLPPDSLVGGAELDQIFQTPDCGLPPPPPPPPVPACSDGIDNDSDGQIDYQEGKGDPGCTSDNDTDETDLAPPATCPPGQTGTPPDCVTPPAASTAYKYYYEVSADLQHFTLWAILEDKDDKQIHDKPNATCKKDPPTGTSFNYCIGD